MGKFGSIKTSNTEDILTLVGFVPWQAKFLESNSFHPPATKLFLIEFPAHIPDALEHTGEFLLLLELQLLIILTIPTITEPTLLPEYMHLNKILI